MTHPRRFMRSLLFACLATFPMVAHAAVTELRVLFDSDNNPATGCTVNGMPGVEQVLVTKVTDDGTTANVTETHRLICAGSVLGGPVDVNTSGWPAGFQSSSGFMLVETAIPSSAFGSGTRLPTPMRVGFAGTRGGDSFSVVAQSNGDPMIFPKGPAGKHRAVAHPGPERVIVLDGLDSDWENLTALAPGSPGGGPSDIKLVQAFAFADTYDFNLYFKFNVNTSGSGIEAVDDFYLRTQGEPTLTVPATIGVLSNDISNDALTAVPVGAPDHGDVTLNPDGSFTYTPDDPSSLATDTFNYKATHNSDESNVATVTIDVQDVNGQPSVIETTFTVDENSADGTVVGTVTVNDDPGDSHTFAIVSGNTGGAFAINPNTGVITVADGSAINFEGDPQYVLVVQATDDGTPPLSDTGNITVDVNDLNDAPVAVPDVSSVAEEGTLTVVAPGVLSNDTDEDVPHTLTAVLVSGPLHAQSFALNPNGSYNYTPVVDYVGTDVFTYRANDGLLDSNTTTVTITITAVNDEPTFAIVADPPASNEDAGPQTVNGFASSISAGPADESAQTLTFTLTPTGTTGDLAFSTGPSIDSSGNLTYTATGNTNGTASFNVVLTDSGSNVPPNDNTSATLSFTITVNAVNDPPSFTLGGNQTVNEDAGLQTVNGFASAISVGPANESAQTISSFNVTNDNNALFSQQPAIDTSGNLTYQTAADANGVATVSVTATDSGGATSSPAQTFLITVNAINDEPSFAILAPPPASNEDAGLQTVNGLASSISAGPADESAQTLTFTLTPTGSTGGLTFSFSPAIDSSGNLTYTATGNTSGTASFDAVLTDSGSNTPPNDNTSATLSFTITVNAVNDAPVVTSSNTVAFTEGGGAIIINNGVLVSDIDSANMSSARVVISLNGDANDVLACPACAGLGLAAVYTAGTFTLNISNAALTADYMTALQSVTFNNPSDAPSSGSRTIDWFATDSSLLESANTATNNSTITVTALNDAPVNTVPAGLQNMNQDSTLIFTGPTQISIADVDAGANIVQVELTATNGTITLSGIAGLSFLYTDGNGTGAGDGTADATMQFRGTIANINTALDGLQFSSTPGFFSGPNARIDIVPNDLGFTGTPGPLTDTDDFVEIFVQQVNQPPVNSVPAAPQPVNEDATLTFSSGNSNLISISDPDAGVAIVQVQLSVTVGTLTLNGTVGLDFGFVADGNGTPAGDGMADATMRFRGTIADINTALEGMTFSAGADVNGSSMLTIVTNDLGNTGPGGAMTDPDPSVTINITAVNDAPVLTSTSPVSAAEDVQFSFTAGDTIGVTDVDSGAGTNFVATLSVTSGTINVTGAGVTGNNTNSVTITGTVAAVNGILGTTKYTGNLNFNGSDMLVVTVNDNGQTGGGNLSATHNITINVSAVNDEPSFAILAPPPASNEDASLQTVNGLASSISAGPADESAQTLTFTLTPTGSTGNLTFSSGPSIDSSGNLTYTATGDTNGTASFNAVLTDSGSNTPPNDNTSATVAFTITVNAVNDAPVITRPVTISVNEDTPFNFTGGNVISIADVDVAAGSMTVSLSVTNGTLSLSGLTGLSFTVGDGAADASMTFSGTLTDVNNALNNSTYTGNLNFNGSDTLNINANDNGNTGTGGSLSDSKSTGITVNAVNDAPVALDKVFAAQAHMRINGLTGLLTGVTDADNGTGPGPCVSTTFTVGTVTPVTGGTIANLNPSAGSFDFIPAAGFTGPASLTYTVVDSGCPGTATSAAANITINVAGPLIYFVKSVPVGIANCTLGNECTLATAIPLATAAAGRHIFISDANTHTPGVAINLNTGGHLMGQGVTAPVDGDGVLTNDFDDLFDIAPPAGTIARPAISAARPTVMNSTITLNTSSQLRGLNVNVTASPAVQSTAKTGLKLTDINIQSNGNAAGTFALDLGTSSGDFTIGTVSINPTRNGSAVRFATTTSTNTVTIGNITTEGGQGFSAASTGTTNFTLSNVTSTTGVAVTTSTTSSGDFTFNDVISTTGGAVSVTTSTGDFIFHAVNSNGAAKGITVTSATGTFTVNGTSTTDGSGGTIQNATSRGAEFISSNNVTLKNMNFTNNGVGGSNLNCGDALGATGTASFVTGAACESNLHLQTVTSAVLTNLNITAGDSHGINGYAVNGLSMTDLNVETNGDEVGEDGVQLVNSSGTITVSGANFFRDNASNQFEAQNGSGSVTLSISGAFFGLTNFPTTGAAEAPSPGSSTNNSGLLISASGTGSMSPTVTGSTFEENYANGYLSDTANSATMTIVLGTALSGNAFNNNGVPIEIVNASSGTMTYTIRNNTISNSTAITGAFATTAITAARSGAGSVMNGTIDDNVIGSSAAGATSSGCFVSGCTGMSLTDSATSSTNAYNVTVSNNEVYHVPGGGITSNIGGGGGSPKTSFIITGNTADHPDGLNQGSAIEINSGTLPASTPQTCVQISANVLNGAWNALNNDELRLRHRGAAGSTFRVRNWDGVGGTGGLDTYLHSVNTFTDFGFQLVGANVFTGGAGACP